MVYDNNWANAAAPSESGPLYCGYFFDSESGLYQVRNRYYDSRLSVWISRDPIGYNGGLNLYQYARSAPHTWLDPTGCDTRDASYDMNGHLTRDQAYQLAGALEFFLVDARGANSIWSWFGEDYSLTLMFLQHYLDGGGDLTLSYDYIKNDPGVKAANAQAAASACDGGNSSEAPVTTVGNDLAHSLGKANVYYTFSNNGIVTERQPDGTCKCFCRATVSGHIHDLYDFHDKMASVTFPISLNFEGWIYGWKGGSTVPDTWMADLADYGYAKPFYVDINWSFSVNKEVPCKK